MMGNTQIRNAKPMGFSVTVSLSLHLLALLVISALGGMGGSSPSVVDVFIVGLETAVEDKRNDNGKPTETWKAKGVAEKPPVSEALPKKNEADTFETFAVPLVLKEAEPAEEKEEDKETEKAVVISMENEYVPQTIEASIEEFDSEAESARTDDKREDVQNLSAISLAAFADNGPVKAYKDYKAGGDIEVSSFNEETAGASDLSTGRNAYLLELKRRIEEALRYPVPARKRMMEGTVLVEFSIDRAGMPENINVTKSSGYGILDREAVRTIKRASPYPALEEKIEIPVRFRLTEDQD